MKVDLLPHNQEAYEKVKLQIAEGKKKIAISHATGTGKSYLIAKLFEDYSDNKKLVLVPSTYISDQIQELFEKYSIQNADVVLYQRLIRMSDEDIAAMDYSLISLDEYHHDISKVWGKKVRKLIDTHPESIIFGTSATPVRSDGVNTIDELFEGNCANDLPLSESIAKKIVPLPKYVGALYTLDDELERLRKKVENATNSKEEKKEYYKKINTMRSQIEKSYGMPIILNKHIKNREGKYIVFCKNKTHLAEIKDTVIGWFRTAGFKDIHAYEVYSDYENKDAEYRAFCDDESHSLKLLFSIAMLNEGLHLENISGVILLRPTKSSIVWHQQIGRAIEANNTNTPVIIDAVNNFSAVRQGMELLNEIKNAIAREKEKDPNFDDTGFEDIDTFFVLEQVLEIKEMFAGIEGRLEGNWDLYIRALKQYREREGDCLVPRDHTEMVDDISVALYNWVSNVRMVKKGKLRGALTDERIKQLDEIGFIWDTLLYEWENGLRHFDKYVKEHNGDVLVPEAYVDEEDGFHTGYWVRNKRSEFKNGKLEKNRIVQLEEKGFVWDVKEYNFLSKVNDIKLFVQENKRLPNSMSKDKYEKNLACFLNRQRDNKRKMEGEYPKWEKEAIESIDGFVWNPTQNYFLLGCKHYERYIKINNSFSIPKDYKTEDGFNSDSWNSSQKNKYRKNRLTENEKKTLMEIGYIFSVNNDNFDKKFEVLKEYMEVNNCDSDIAQETIFKGEKLGQFVSSMRSAYKNNSISEYRKEKLESINFIWDVKDKKWEDKLKWFKKNKDENGKINISKNDISVKSYYYWLIDQRKLYKKGQMREDRRKLFEQVVMN